MQGVRPGHPPSPNRSPMILFLMRHANAGTVRENPVLDTRRGLIKEGKDQCMLMARVLWALEAPIDAIVSSPLKRARQTAQLVGTELGYDAQVEVSPALGLSASYADFQDLLAKICRPRGNPGGGAQSKPISVSRPDGVGQRRRGNSHAERFHRAGGHAAASAAVAVAAGSAHGPLDLRQRNEEFAPKDLAKIAGLLAQRPQLQFRARATRTQLQVDSLGVETDRDVEHVAGAVLI